MRRAAAPSARPTPTPPSPSSARSPTCPTSGRGCPRTTCRARSGPTTCSCTREHWYAEQRHRRSAARSASTAIDRAAHEVVTADGERVGYDRLLLATGSSPAPAAVDGADLDGVHTLRTLEDSTAVKDAIAAGGPLVVVGAGWIGLEVASAARAAGVDVTVVHDASVPLGRVLGDLVGQRFADLATSAGVTLVAAHAPSRRLTGAGRVEGVELADGRTLPASTVVVARRHQPALELAEQAGLAVDDGVLVDDTFRTADAAVFAVGDVARAQNGWVGEQVRLEHYAARQRRRPGRRARHGRRGRGPLGRAAVLLERPVRGRPGVPRLGRPRPATTSSCAPAAPASETGTPWFAFWHDAGRLVAGMHVDGWDDADTVKDLVTGRTPSSTWPGWPTRPCPWPTSAPEPTGPGPAAAPGRPSRAT